MIFHKKFGLQNDSFQTKKIYPSLYVDFDNFRGKVSFYTARVKSPEKIIKQILIWSLVAKLCFKQLKSETFHCHCAPMWQTRLFLRAWTNEKPSQIFSGRGFEISSFMIFVMEQKDRDLPTFIKSLFRRSGIHAYTADLATESFHASRNFHYCYRFQVERIKAPKEQNLKSLTRYH